MTSERERESLPCLRGRGRKRYACPDVELEVEREARNSSQARDTRLQQMQMNSYRQAELKEGSTLLHNISLTMHAHVSYQTLTAE